MSDDPDAVLAALAPGPDDAQRVFAAADSVVLAWKGVASNHFHDKVLDLARALAPHPGPDTRPIAQQCGWCGGWFDPGTHICSARPNTEVKQGFDYWDHMIDPTLDQPTPGPDTARDGEVERLRRREPTDYVEAWFRLTIPERDTKAAAYVAMHVSRLTEERGAARRELDEFKAAVERLCDEWDDCYSVKFVIQALRALLTPPDAGRDT